MGYLDDLLSDGEMTLIKAHRHPLFVVLRTLPYALLSILLWLLAGFATTRLAGNAQTGVVLGLLAASLYPLGRAAQKFLTWKTEEYVVTNYRIIQIEGLINKRTLDSALEKINDLRMTQSVFGRMFNYGTIEILTAAEHGVNSLDGIAAPLRFKKALMDAKLELSDGDRSTRFGNSGTDRDIARLLGALTDLRDSGVISREEYDSRRNALLRR